MEENAFDKIKSMINNGNIPEDLQKIVSNMSSSSNGNESSNKNTSISPEAISNLMSMLNGSKGDSTHTDNTQSNSSEYSNNSNESSKQNDNNFNNMGIDFETILKFKTIMDKMNSKDDPRSKLLVSLKPYLKDSRKSKVDQYIQFLNMSKVIDVFSKQNGDGKLWV